MRELWQQAQFLAALDGLGAAGGSKLVEGAGTVCLDGVLGNEELGGDLAIAEAAGNQVEDFELSCGDAEGLLLGCIGSEGDCVVREGRGGGDKHFPNYDSFPNGFALSRDAEAEPDAEGREEDGDERTVELDGVFDDDEAVFSVLKDGDEEAADETEDEDVALHDRDGGSITERAMEWLRLELLALFARTVSFSPMWPHSFCSQADSRSPKSNNLNPASARKPRQMSDLCGSIIAF